MFLQLKLPQFSRIVFVLGVYGFRLLLGSIRKFLSVACLKSKKIIELLVLVCFVNFKFAIDHYAKGVTCKNKFNLVACTMSCSILQWQAKFYQQFYLYIAILSLWICSRDRERNIRIFNVLITFRHYFFKYETPDNLIFIKKLFNETSLLEKEDLYSHLNTGPDYTHVKSVCEDFKIKKFRRIPWFVCSVWCIIASFQSMFFKTHELNPARVFTAPGLAW